MARGQAKELSLGFLIPQPSRRTMASKRQLKKEIILEVTQLFDEAIILRSLATGQSMELELEELMDDIMVLTDDSLRRIPTARTILASSEPTTVGYVSTSPSTWRTSRIALTSSSRGSTASRAKALAHITRYRYDFAKETCTDAAPHPRLEGRGLAAGSSCRQRHLCRPAHQ